MKPYALFFLTAALLAGCRAADDIIVPACPYDGLAAYQAFVQRNGAPTQAFAFDLSQAQMLRTSSGASLQFGAGAFALPNGTPATGAAELRVRELYTVADMILADQPSEGFGAPLSDNRLVVGGQFQVQAWQGSTQLRLRSADTLYLTSPRPTSPRATPLTGLTTWSQTAAAPLWVDSRLAARVSVTSNGMAPPYQSRLPLGTANWLAIGQRWSLPISTAPANLPTTWAQFSFDTSPDSTATFTQAWIVPAGANAVFRSVFSSTSPRASSPNVAAFLATPVGSQLTAVVLQFRADGLYFGTQAATIQSSQLISLPLTKLTEAEVVQRIRRL